MAKRHHSSMKARMDEHMGMERYERGPVREKSEKGHMLDGYAGMETRESNQYRTGEYVDESRTGYADMPQQVEYKKYASMPYGLDEYLDDGIGGIDRQVMEDRDMVKRGLQPKKY